MPMTTCSGARPGAQAVLFQNIAVAVNICCLAESIVDMPRSLGGLDVYIAVVSRTEYSVQSVESTDTSNNLNCIMVRRGEAVL